VCGRVGNADDDTKVRTRGHLAVLSDPAEFWQVSNLLSYGTNTRVDDSGAATMYWVGAQTGGVTSLSTASVFTKRWKWINGELSVLDLLASHSNLQTDPTSTGLKASATANIDKGSSQVMVDSAAGLKVTMPGYNDETSSAYATDGDEVSYAVTGSIYQQPWMRIDLGVDSPDQRRVAYVMVNTMNWVNNFEVWLSDIAYASPYEYGSPSYSTQWSTSGQVLCGKSTKVVSANSGSGWTTINCHHVPQRASRYVTVVMSPTTYNEPFQVQEIKVMTLEDSPYGASMCAAMKRTTRGYQLVAHACSKTLPFLCESQPPSSASVL